MPTYKGITISVISQRELRIVPEFPHPESSQFTNKSPNPNFKEQATFVDSKADRILGRQSAVTVYIPSLAGSRFWLRYKLLDSAISDSPWYYFKLFMNGRHITSWGTNSVKQPSGQVMRALFEPNHRWNFKDGGILYKKSGTETRPFYFNKVEEDQSAADNGGLIEVQAFRARGRTKRVAKLEGFRDQQKYGIFLPSGGLLEEPEDAKYYDWHLRDPKDNPFAVFRFQYRSWDYLASLQLIPDDHPRQLLPPTPSVLNLNGVVPNSPEFGEEEVAGEVAEDPFEDEDAQRQSFTRSSFSSEDDTGNPWITDVFDSNNDNHPNDKASTSLYTASGPPINFQPPPRISSAADNLDLIPEDVHQPSGSPATAAEPVIPEDIWESMKNRPLPPIPTRSSSRASGSSSTSGSGVSVTSSLKSWVNRGLGHSPPPFIGIARAVTITSVPRGAVRLIDIEPRAKKPELRTESPATPAEQGLQYTPSSYNESPNQQEESPSPMPDMSNITMRHSHRLKRIQKSDSLPKVNVDGYSPVGMDMDESPSRMTGNTSMLSSMPESEWMCRTPSPVKNDPEHLRVMSLQSPRPPKGYSALGQQDTDYFEDEGEDDEEEEDFDGGEASEQDLLMRGNFF